MKIIAYLIILIFAAPVFAENIVDGSCLGSGSDPSSNDNSHYIRSLLPKIPKIQLLANIALMAKVNSLYEKASACKEPEIDHQSNMNVHDWMKIIPKIPSVEYLMQLSSVANEAKKYAEVQRGSDKVKHCFAGCYIRKKLDLTSAVFIGWLKELSDASDCSLKTHFEKADYEATVAGGYAGKDYSCEKFCQFYRM